MLLLKFSPTLRQTLIRAVRLLSPAFLAIARISGSFPHSIRSCLHKNLVTISVCPSIAFQSARTVGIDSMPTVLSKIPSGLIPNILAVSKGSYGCGRAEYSTQEPPPSPFVLSNYIPLASCIQRFLLSIFDDGTLGNTRYETCIHKWYVIIS